MNVWPTLLFAVAGCGAGYMSSEDAPNFSGADDMADTATGGDASEEDSEPPAYWDLSATLEIVDGALVAGDSTLFVTLQTEDRTEICTAILPVSNVDTLTEPTGDGIYGWWSIRVAEPTSGECFTVDLVSPIPDPVYIGIGSLHPEIAAVMGAHPDLVEDATTSALRGAYASFDDGQVIYVFGLAGTAETFAGEVADGSDLNIPGGTWSIRPIYPFSYASE